MIIETLQVTYDNDETFVELYHDVFFSLEIRLEICPRSFKL